MSSADGARDRGVGLTLFMGTVRRGECETLERRGLPLGLLADTNSEHKMADLSRFALVERFDFSRPEEDLIAAVASINERHPVACLYNVNEVYVAPTATVAAALGFHGLSRTAAELSLDKLLMRQRFMERLGRDAVAQFRTVRSENELLEFAAENGFPVFLQPTNVSASMWATRNDSRASLIANYRALVEEVPRYYQRLGQRTKSLGVVAAEYLEGENTSIDCIIDRAGRPHTTPVVDVLTGKDVGVDDYHHFARILPSRLPAERQRELAELAVAGVRALDLRSAAAHVEFIGRRLGEIAARPGGNRPRILDLAHGIDELFAYHQALTGKVPDLERRKDRAAAIVTPFPRRGGILRRINHLERMSALPGYLYHEVRAQPGQRVGLAKGGFRAPLYVELSSDDAGDVRRSVETLASWTDLYDVE